MRLHDLTITAFSPYAGIEWVGWEALPNATSSTRLSSAVGVRRRCDEAA
jgi:hypothetical protein